MKTGLLVKYGEIAIRGKNRGQFEAQLIGSIRKNINGLGDYYIQKEQGRFFIFKRDGNVDMEILIERVICIFGIVGVCPCIVNENKDVETAEKMVFEYFENNYGDLDKTTTFRVNTIRADKRFPMESNDLSSHIGGILLDKYPILKVDIHNPDILINIEIRNSMYVFSKVLKGNGGLPQGSSGKGVLLLSGGIDSPVAGYLMEKRGIALEAVYFDSPPYTSERAKEKVIDLAKRLSYFSGGKKLNILPFTKIQLFLYESVPHEKLTIFLKRAMIKAAEKIALRVNADALITGDSVGQVASQTLKGIKSMESATSLPILRPLCGFDKQEIVDLAKKIGTYEISIRPYEDCCTIFVAKHPEINPKASIIESMESKFSEQLEEMLEEAVNSIERIEL